MTALPPEGILMRALEPWHIILLVIVLLVLFGSKRLPDAARGLGRSLRIFKSEVKDLTTDDREQAHTPTSHAAPPTPSTPPPAQLQGAPAPPSASAPLSAPGAGADGARDSVPVPRE